MPSTRGGGGGFGDTIMTCGPPITTLEEVAMHAVSPKIATMTKAEDLNADFDSTIDIFHYLI